MKPKQEVQVDGGVCTKLERKRSSVKAAAACRLDLIFGGGWLFEILIDCSFFPCLFVSAVLAKVFNFYIFALQPRSVFYLLLSTTPTDFTAVFIRGVDEHSRIGCTPKYSF